ncbi:PREDICTED: tubulin polyglutamylase ttll6 [Dinoponera quadriceps]|uniref:Tubulin polyglutamylase ttll6 n=1 Tax=Dinoponera quadriceps TaxID=609295 RepID=A0A6P3WYQ1_DINQU|nr:PREDICTED: tubulin polyglutamylase ttll6 [Dinoponera quadriceps]
MSPEKEHENEPGKEEAEECTVGERVMSLRVKTVLKILLSSVAGPLILYGMFLTHQRYQTRATQPSEVNVGEDRLRFWVYARRNDTGYLKHVRAVLSRLGFRESDNEPGWDLLWAHDYPFHKLSASLHRLQQHQRVNHFPGCGYVTNKVDLSISAGRYIPAAFRMPDDRERFLRYADANPTKKFVQKLNDHRGIRLVDSRNASLTDGIFVQEFVERPYLVDGYKFDIGLYIVVTSVDPLRLYVYKGDVLFRFCPIAYHPFDAEVVTLMAVVMQIKKCVNCNLSIFIYPILQ